MEKIMIRLSHSAIERYKSCPRSYKLHYIDKIREEQIGSALFFGGAIDAALGEMKKLKMPSYKGEIRDPFEVFLEKMSKCKYNKEEIELPFTLKTRYLTSDYDEDLIIEEYIPELRKYLVENGYESDNPIEVMRQLQRFIKVNGFIKLDELDKIFYNYCSWISLCVKGSMMIDAYKKDLLPQIEEVISIQKEVNLPNSSGDYITGYIDFEAKLVGKTGIWTCDDKTSGNKYKNTSIKESQQLCIYSEYTNNNQAAYFVLIKKVRKTQHKTCLKCGKITTGREQKCSNGGTGKNRCNGDFKIKTICSIDTQIITDEITEEQKDLTFSGFHDILYNIREENFPRIRHEECFQYGKRCSYFERCHGKDRNSMEGLVNMKADE